MKPSKKAEIVQITKVRMQKELKDKLERAAGRNNRTHNGELVHRLEQSFLQEETELREDAFVDIMAALAPHRKGDDGKPEIDAAELAKRFADILRPRLLTASDSHLSRYLADYMKQQRRPRGAANNAKPNPKPPTERNE
jgi:hypothetical protein